MVGKSPLETLKGNFFPGGRAECLCVFSDYCLWLEIWRASSAPLEGPGNPVVGIWEMCPNLTYPDTHLLTVDTGVPGYPIATYSEVSSHRFLLRSTGPLTVLVIPIQIQVSVLYLFPLPQATD